MRVTVDTTHDSHEDIRKVVKMLQHLVGDSQEVFTNRPEAVQEASPMANIFGDAPAQTATNSSEITQETQQQEAQAETKESTEDLFAELFSEEEIKKMDTASVKEEEEPEIKPKGKKFNIEFY